MFQILSGTNHLLFAHKDPRILEFGFPTPPVDLPTIDLGHEAEHHISFSCEASNATQPFSMMSAARFAFCIFLLATVALAAVLPSTSDRNQQTHLARLSSLQAPNKLVCKATAQRMRCYGGPFVTAQTCALSCICEEGRISCPSYSHCDDNSMDTFCGSLCGCGVGADKNVKTMTNREILMSAHRYAAPANEIDDEDDFDSEDDSSSKAGARRTSSYRERQRQTLA